MSYKGIDVSYAQSTINWQAVKSAGIEFAMIRAGYGDDISQKDSEFDNNVQGALSVGIHVGCHWFSYASSVADAIKEAQVMKQIITKYSGKLDYPMAFDFEGASIAYFEKINGRAPSKQEIEDMTNAFLGEMTRGCWYAVNYSNINFVENYNANASGSDRLWLADYNQSDPAFPCGMRQTQSDGREPGVSTNLDMDIAYIDYPAIIRAAHLNGYVAKPAAPVPAQAPTAQTYTVKAGDCMSSIASAHGIGLQTLLNLNPQVKAPNYVIHAGDAITLSGTVQAAPTPQSVTYVVKPGDTLGGIAAKYGTTYQHLAQVNGILNPNLIRAGQTLKIK